MPGAIAVAVGFPTPDGVFISKTDFALMAQYVSALKDWIAAAAVCLENR